MRVPCRLGDLPSQGQANDGYFQDGAGRLYAEQHVGSGSRAPERGRAVAGPVDDPGTGVDAGWGCLELGGGGGSIASWLCSRVGSSGRVVATDVEPRFLLELEHPNLEVLRHDVATEPLPEAEFDLVHARLVLSHLAQRESIVTKLVNALKPGGWLVLEVRINFFLKVFFL